MQKTKQNNLPRHWLFAANFKVFISTFDIPYYEFKLLVWTLGEERVLTVIWFRESQSDFINEFLLLASYSTYFSNFESILFSINFWWFLFSLSFLFKSFSKEFSFNWKEFYWLCDMLLNEFVLFKAILLG